MTSLEIVLFMVSLRVRVSVYGIVGVWVTFPVFSEVLKLAAIS